MQGLQEKLKEIEKLALNPFMVEPLQKELEELQRWIPNLKREEQELLRDFLQRLRTRLEENYLICFGWLERALEKGFESRA